MGILGKKKKHSAPSEDDFKLLDTSVSELSEQTNALLTHFGEKKPENSKTTKPIMPKQSTSKKTPGRSFDIIQGSNVVNAKRAKKTVTIDAPTDAVELLPEHAGKSFNEVSPEEAPKKDTVSITETVTVKSEEVEDYKKEAQEVVVGHPAGSLRFDSTEEEPVTLHDEVDSDSTQQGADTNPVVEKVKVDTDSTDSKSEGTNESPQPDKKSEEDETTGDLEKKESIPATGEVFASNLVSNELPKGYEAPEGQQQPTVFDTNEYHPELHDWSKLDRGHGGKWYILALLIAIAAALAYFIFSGQKLPFIS